MKLVFSLGPVVGSLLCLLAALGALPRWWSLAGLAPLILLVIERHFTDEARDRQARARETQRIEQRLLVAETRVEVLDRRNQQVERELLEQRHQQ